MSVRIMVIDDEPEVLGLIKDTVEPLGWYEVLTLRDSREAARQLQTQKFEGVVVDVQMPHLDGFEVTKFVRGSPFNGGIPIVMLTEDDDIETMRRGFNAGVTFFMVNPSSRALVYTLFNAVRGAMVGERRRHVGLLYRAKVNCNWGNHGEKHFTAESLTISQGGMSLTPSGGLAVGQELDLEFDLPQLPGSARPTTTKPRKSIFAESETPLAGPRCPRVRVVYKGPTDSIGLEFVALPPAYREAIQRYTTWVATE